ncbi:MACPF domain-containing protein At4g24290-like [Nymphaea colorata]|nr:MACPF domain-containing protein At4g24290-like [Nymphaea colorata]
MGEPGKTRAELAAERAIGALGMGYDLTNDVRLAYCKGGGRLLELHEAQPPQKVRLPDGTVVAGVPGCVRVDKGERLRFKTDALSFQQMSEHFNQWLSLSGKIPSGLFNAMFGFHGCWQKDASTTKSLAYDGWFITLYNVELDRSHIGLQKHVKREVPSAWYPAALARFIEKYGTHVIVGVKMGGKDVVHVKQQHKSMLQPAQMQKMLTKLADDRFADAGTTSILSPVKSSSNDAQLAIREHRVTFSNSGSTISHSKKEAVVSICIRRGGIDTGQEHNEWLATVPLAPDAISMSLVPITSLLNGVPGSGFLIHAVNLYLRYKPAIEELHNFLEYQLPRQWAPVYAEHSLVLQPKQTHSSKLQFSIMDSALYVNTTKVDSERKPVTGIRLFLEGKKQNRLAIHLQHLSSRPGIFQVSDDLAYESDICEDRRYFDPVKWKFFSRVCTAPVELSIAFNDDAAGVVTQASFHVAEVNMKKVLFLRLGFSMVKNARIRRSEWDGASSPTHKSSVFSTLISTRLGFSQVPLSASLEKVDMNSAIFAGGPPSPTKAPKMLRFVDLKEVARGPEDTPGYWVVTGAKLCVEGGKIAVQAKYSLLTIHGDSDDESAY